MPGVQRGVHGSSTTTQPGPVRRTPPWLCRGSGEEHKGGEAGEESYGEREANRQAVTSKAEESGELQEAAAQYLLDRGARLIEVLKRWEK